MHLSLAHVGLILLSRQGYARGWFTETCKRDTFAGLQIIRTFVLDSHSRSTCAFALRGLHFQTPPRDTQAGEPHPGPHLRRRRRRAKGLAGLRVI